MERREARTGDVGADGNDVSVPRTVIVATFAVLAAAWALDSFVLRTGLLASWRGGPALTPLYAFWSPYARPTAALFPPCALAFVFLAPRLADPERTRRAVFLPALTGGAAALALALYLVRMPAETLGVNFNLYRDEEFWHDAQRIEHVRAYLAHYVELMPQFSTHGKHFPPGHALLLASVIAGFGKSELAAGAVVLTCAVAALPFAWLALRELVGERAARQGALLVACAPAFLDFACTAMDAVFFLAASVALWLGLRAFGARGRSLHALAAGVALCVATFVSFSALPLGFVLAAYALWTRRLAAWRPLAIVGATYAACVSALWIATDFSLVACFEAGHAHAQAFMGRARDVRPNTERWRLVLGNGVAFAAGAGAPLVAACAARFAGGGVPRDAWTKAVVVALALMCAIHYLETERIWIYALPWIAAVALVRGPIDARSLRVLVALSLAQALAMEIALFTLW